MFRRQRIDALYHPGSMDLRGFEVHVLDRVVDGPKPDLVKALGATYHTVTIQDVGGEADIVLESTGAGQLIWDVMAQAVPSGIVCLTGVSTGGRTLGVDLGAFNGEVVLQNNVVFGTVMRIAVTIRRPRTRLRRRIRHGLSM